MIASTTRSPNPPKRFHLVFHIITTSFIVLCLFPVAPGDGQENQANRLTYLDEFCNPYHVGRDFAKLTTPQWIGDDDVEAVITLGIDDMRDPEKYETYLRPILNRLKKIDGRAPVSIFACSVNPAHKQLKTWLTEGVSIECHTVDHPCPCLQNGKLDVAASTYHRCVDMMYQIANNRPVAFRFPCCDSLNTPSPRAFNEIVHKQSEKGHFLQASSSVVCLLTDDDPDLPVSIFSGEKNRFGKYLPFPSFVNRIDNYPYPFLIGGKCWEFPIAVPDDWQGQNIQRPNNPKTVDDMKAVVDATVAKKGIMNIVFHPHGWIRAEQIVQLIDYTEKKYGKKVKFLTFKECVDRINRNLLIDHPVRHRKTGNENGVRLLDIDGDGFLDVLIGNSRTRKTRIWKESSQQYSDASHSLNVERCRFGIADGKTWCLQENSDHKFQLFCFSVDKASWINRFPEIDFQQKQSDIRAVRLRDLDLDGKFEIIHAAPGHVASYKVDFRTGKLTKKPFPIPLVDKKYQDNGVRFVDLNLDGHDDLIASNDQVSSLMIFDPENGTFREQKPGTELPKIVTAGTNNGVWFAKNHLWVQNEFTHRMPDGVDRRSFHQILGEDDPLPRSPRAAIRSFRLSGDFKIELMASEPMVMDPIALEWGIDGKLWVVEMADYPLGLDDKGKPGGRIRFLEDTDGDGKYDRSTLFAKGIPFPTGVLPLNTDPEKPACLISAAPYLVYLDRPGTWDQLIQREHSAPASGIPTIWLKGFVEGNQQHRFNGFARGLDNWIYLANGDSGGSVTPHGSDKPIRINGRDLRFEQVQIPGRDFKSNWKPRRVKRSLDVTLMTGAMRLGAPTPSRFGITCFRNTI